MTVGNTHRGTVAAVGPRRVRGGLIPGTVYSRLFPPPPRSAKHFWQTFLNDIVGG